MHIFKLFLTVLGAVFFSSASWSDTKTFEHGGDTFISGGALNETVEARGDVFITARSARANGNAGGDLHVMGFDVSVDADVDEDLYAIGNSVAIGGSVAQDLTAMGMSLRTESSATTAGNARMMANTLTIEGPITGALLALGQDVILNAPIEGDARIVARTITFGPQAVIAGTLTYSTRSEITVPERVAAPARVVFEKYSGSQAWEEFDRMRHEMPIFPTFVSLLFGFVISLLFFVVLGAIMIGFMPKRLEHMRRSIATAPGQTMLLGIIGLSILFGMIPIVGLTIIGLPFVPIVVLCIVVAWTLGYALGAYSIAMRLWVVLGGETEPGNIARLSVFALAIIVIALLNFIPFAGWMANYTLVLLGIGAMTNALFQRLIGNPGIALDVDLRPIEDENT